MRNRSTLARNYPSLCVFVSENFSVEDMESLNSLLDVQDSRLHGRAVVDGVSVFCVATQHTVTMEKFTSPFFERFHFTGKAVPELFHADPLEALNVGAAVKTPLDLKCSPHWESPLLGSISINAQVCSSVV